MFNLNDIKFSIKSESENKTYDISISGLNTPYVEINIECPDDNKYYRVLVGVGEEESYSLSNVINHIKKMDEMFSDQTKQNVLQYLTDVNDC